MFYGILLVTNDVMFIINQCFTYWDHPMFPFQFL